MRLMPDATASMPSPVIRSRPGWQEIDTVWLVTIYALLLMLIPATLIFAPLGGVGTPATVFSYVIPVWYLAVWTAGTRRRSGGGRGIRIAMLVFALALLVSFVAGMTRDITSQETLAADSGLIWLGSGAGLVVVLCEAVTDYHRLEVLLRRLVILGSVISVVGLLQYAGVDLTQLIHIPGLSVNAVDVNITGARNGFNRVQGTASQPIEFGVVLAMLTPIALQQAFDPAYGGRLRRWVPVALIAFTASLSISRSAVIGLGITLIVLLPTWKQRRRLGALGILVLSLAVVHQVVHGLIGTFRNLFEGIFSGQDSSVNDRVADYSGVSSYISQRPIFGRGFGTFLPLVYRYTDNMYLLATVEMGIVGVVAMFFLFVAGAHAAVLGRRKTVREGRREIGQALLASMAVAAVTSATFDSLAFPMFSGVFFILLGCCGAYNAIMTAEAEETMPLTMRLPMGLPARLRS